MTSHEYTFKAGTIELVADDDYLRAQETRDPRPFSDRLAGFGFSAVCIAAAVFFWFMPVENPGEVFWLRLILCGGLAAVGLVLLAGAIGEKTSFEFIEADRRSGVLISGRDTKAGREITNTMQLSAIDNIFLGSEALNHAAKTLESTQTLYVSGKGAPKKGILFTGAGLALNEVKSHIQRLAGSR
jgi:hypothetical protein